MDKKEKESSVAAAGGGVDEEAGVPFGMSVNVNVKEEGKLEPMHSMDQPVSRLGSTDSEARSVRMGMAYSVSLDSGLVTAVKDAASASDDEHNEEGSPEYVTALRGDDISELSMVRMGESNSSTIGSKNLQMEKAFSFRTLEKLKVARGKSYEGEDFCLSWKITLQVNVTPGKKDKKAHGAAAPTKKTILNGVTGHAEKQQLVAVMGSSGCGKTSFLDCLSMRNQGFIGNIFVNGKEIDGRFFTLAGFVHQDDIFIPTETVREHLTFHAMLRCDPCIRKELRVQRVEKLIKAVNLGHVANSKLGGPGSFIRGLSGGERRRVSFATELLSDPVIIFADEATTGLDAAMAKSVCQSLRSIANSGRLVLATIHQPSSETFNLFTHVMLMTQGHVVYMGPRKTLGKYFESLGDPAYACPSNHNPADFYVQLVALNPDAAEVSQARIDALVQGYDNSSEKLEMSSWQDDVLDQELLLYHRTFKMRHFLASSMTQFRLCCERNVRSLYRDPFSFAAAVLSGIITGFILGGAYFAPPNQPITPQQVKDKEGLFFLANLQVFLISLYSVVMAFSMETKVFMRENQAGANRVGAYYSAKMLTNWAVEFLTPFLFGTIVWGLAGLERSAEAFSIFIAILILNALCFGSLGFVLSAMTGDAQVALAIAPVLVLPNIVFSGIMFDLNQAHGIRLILSYTAVLRFSIAGMLHNEYRPSPTRYTAEVPNPEAVLQRVNAFSMRGDILGLVICCLFFRILAYVILARRTKRERIKVL